MFHLTLMSLLSRMTHCLLTRLLCVAKHDSSARGTIAAPSSPSFSLSQCSQKDEAPTHVQNDQKLCSPSHVLVPQPTAHFHTTPESSRTPMVAVSTSSPTETTVSSTDPVLHRRRCAEAHDARVRHEALACVRAEAQSQHLPCKSFLSNL